MNSEDWLIMTTIKFLLTADCACLQLSESLLEPESTQGRMVSADVLYMQVGW